MNCQVAMLQRGEGLSMRESPLTRQRVTVTKRRYQRPAGLQGACGRRWIAVPTSTAALQRSPRSRQPGRSRPVAGTRPTLRTGPPNVAPLPVFRIAADWTRHHRPGCCCLRWLQTQLQQALGPGPKAKCQAISQQGSKVHLVQAQALCMGLPRHGPPTAARYQLPQCQRQPTGRFPARPAPPQPEPAPAARGRRLREEPTIVTATTRCWRRLPDALPPVATRAPGPP
mmetsp:Transcript_87050/g.246784  ORF Transcript_87050/g.246784 Transcript_87050/m.246784 type:complete len:227 (+) Transcript_87050:162-842(+)